MDKNWIRLGTYFHSEAGKEYFEVTEGRMGLVRKIK
jgi:hypothetical protein